MELVPVESSNVRSIGYNAEVKLLRVVYRDGNVYDHEEISPEFHAALMAAPSKGKFLARHLKGGMKHEPIQLREATMQAGPLSTFKDDLCCGAALSKAMLGGGLDAANSWTCPKCGCEWKPRTVGTLRHWEPHELIATFRV